MTRGVRLMAVALAATGGVAPAADGLTELIAQGERWWTTSPDPGNPVACATCHYDPAETRGWAASFPKFKPLPPPHARVMTLLQANADAVTRHYRQADPRPGATAITAYLAARGAGVPITPGISAGQPVFSERLRALSRAVAAGQRLYARRCGPCHAPAAIAPNVAAFPRVTRGRAESLETLLEHHPDPGAPLAWNGEPMAQLIAYLVSERAGRPLSLGWRTTVTSAGGISHAR
jgi:mono/diheme cytochrome c family protein